MSKQKPIPKSPTKKGARRRLFHKLTTYFKAWSYSECDHHQLGL